MESTGPHVVEEGRHSSRRSLLDRLGTHRRGAGCVWVRRLEDIDLEVLRELVAHAWQSGPGSEPGSGGTD